jgi:hypothetical protein
VVRAPAKEEEIVPGGLETDAALKAQLDAALVANAASPGAKDFSRPFSLDPLFIHGVAREVVKHDALTIGYQEEIDGSTLMPTVHSLHVPQRVRQDVADHEQLLFAGR